jgi:signal peptidase II
VTALNNGAAFGIVQGQSFLLTLISFFALLIVIAVFLFGSIKNRFYQVTMGLLAAGISGNLYDRIFNDGRVRDFIDVVYWPGKHWPAFNVADSLLCIAVGLILLVGLTQKPCQKHAQQQK